MSLALQERVASATIEPSAQRVRVALKFKLSDESFELVLGDASRSADLNRLQLALIDEAIQLRSTDGESGGRLIDREENVLRLIHASYLIVQALSFHAARREIEPGLMISLGWPGWLSEKHVERPPRCIFERPTERPGLRK